MDPATPVVVAADVAAMPSVDVQVDPSDPVVAALAWGISVLLHKYLGRRWRRYRHVVPIMAVVVAVFLRAGWEAAMGQPIGLPTLLRSIAAGAIAVGAHSQTREAKKFREDRGRDRATSAGDRGAGAGDAGVDAGTGADVSEAGSPL